MDGVKLEFEGSALKRIAELAIKKNIDSGVIRDNQTGEITKISKSTQYR